MKEKLNQIAEEIANRSLRNRQEIEAFKREVSGKTGSINALFEQFKTLPTEEKKVFGPELNRLKQSAQERINAAMTELESATMAVPPADATLPAAPFDEGSRHPIHITQQKIIRIFQRIGYTVEEGPDIETDWYNFTALNFEPDHPARDMQDTFFVARDPDVLMRTHTSNTQIRVMERDQPPIRILAPGRCYRNETISARAHCYFNQVEGLAIDKGVSFAELKQTLLYFARQMFGEDVDIRLRPSYFPFTEISAEMDVSCLICKGEGCPVCKHTGWTEILGCGMVDPNVLRNCGHDPDVYSGFAFGMGVERIAQLLYRVPDLRFYSQNDVRLLRQFDAAF